MFNVKCYSVNTIINSQLLDVYTSNIVTLNNVSRELASIRRMGKHDATKFNLIKIESLRIKPQQIYSFRNSNQIDN